MGHSTVVLGATGVTFTSIACLPLIRSVHEVRDCDMHLSRAPGDGVSLTTQNGVHAAPIFAWSVKEALDVHQKLLEIVVVWFASIILFEYLGNRRVKTQRGLLCVDEASLTEVPEYRCVLTSPVGVKKSIQHLSCESEWCKRHANTVPTWINIAEKCKRSTGGGLEQTPIVCFENCLHKSVLPPMFLTSYMIRSGYQHTHTKNYVSNRFYFKNSLQKCKHESQFVEPCFLTHDVEQLSQS